MSDWKKSDNLPEDDFEDSIPEPIIEVEENILEFDEEEGKEEELEVDDVIIDSQIAKVSLVGVGMRTHAGIASTAFKALSENDVNIQMISTSEIKITIVINESAVTKAVKALHEAFELEK